MDSSLRAPKRRRLEGGLSEKYANSRLPATAVPTAAGSRPDAFQPANAALNRPPEISVTSFESPTRLKNPDTVPAGSLNEPSNPDLLAAQQASRTIKAKTYRHRRKPVTANTDSPVTEASTPAQNTTDSIDVYDDFDGALRGASPRVASNSPYREKETNGETNSAQVQPPARTPSDRRSLQTFFKQFVEEDVSDSSEDPLEKEDVIKVRGPERESQTDREMVSSDEDEEMGDNVNVAPRDSLSIDTRLTAVIDRSPGTPTLPSSTQTPATVKKKRGRPRKNPEEIKAPAEPKKRGRPRKNSADLLHKRRERKPKKVQTDDPQDVVTNKPTPRQTKAPKAYFSDVLHPITAEIDNKSATNGEEVAFEAPPQALMVIDDQDGQPMPEEIDDGVANNIEVSLTPSRKKRQYIKSTPKSQLAQPLPDSFATEPISIPFPLTTPKPTVALYNDLQWQESDAKVSDPASNTVIESRKLANLANEVTAVFEPAHIQIAQAVILEKVSGKRPIPQVNRQEEYAKISTLITQTIDAGESNSLLVIGARGTGKSALVNQILREQHDKYPDTFHVVRLNGFIHTDDKIALREIWRQLGRELDGEDEDSLGKANTNYADTLISLLALLSHRSELEHDQPDMLTNSVVFILDEFDLFATHPRQTLLYNLFDIAQSRKAPIAVLGLTTRIDVAERLEKRVKSRFSHRYVHLSQPKTFQAFEEICKSVVHVTESDVGSQMPPDVLAGWNAVVEDLFTSESFQHHLYYLFCLTKSVPDFLNSIILPISKLSCTSSCSALELLDQLTKNSTSLTLYTPPDSRLSLLASLGALQLALLICAARLTAIYSVESVSFAPAYDEYKSNASKAKLHASASGALAQGAATKIWSKDIAHDAWDALMQAGLLIPDTRAGGAGKVDIALEEIALSGVDLGVWAKLCREV